MTIPVAPRDGLSRVLFIEELSALIGKTATTIRTCATNAKYVHLIPALSKCLTAGGCVGMSMKFWPGLMPAERPLLPPLDARAAAQPRHSNSPGNNRHRNRDRKPRGRDEDPRAHRPQSVACRF